MFHLFCDQSLTSAVCWCPSAPDIFSIIWRKVASSFLSSDMLADFNGMFDVQNNVYNELAILQTKDLLEKVINEMKLNITYYNKGDIRDNEQYHKSPFYADYKPLGDTIPYVNFQLTSFSFLN